MVDPEFADKIEELEHIAIFGFDGIYSFRRTLFAFDTEIMCTKSIRHQTKWIEIASKPFNFSAWQ